MALLASAAEPTPPAPGLGKQTPTLLPLSAPPASLPTGAPSPDGAEPLAAADREIGLIIVFVAQGEAEPMRG